MIALDLPGHGGSSKEVGDGSLRTLARAVIATLDALGVERAHLVGHSLGGAVAARLALDHPERVSSLSLICPAYLPGTRIDDSFLTGIAGAQRAKEVRPLLERLLADPAAVTGDMVDAMVRYKRLDGVEEALTIVRDQMVAGVDAAELQGDLARLPASSRHRQPAGPHRRPARANALPCHLRLVWIDDAGHMPHLEQAAGVNADPRRSIALSAS